MNEQRKRDACEPHFRHLLETINDLHQIGATLSWSRLDLEQILGALEMASFVGHASLQKRAEDLRTSTVYTMARTLERTMQFHVENDAMVGPFPMHTIAAAVGETRFPHGHRVSIVSFNYDLGMDVALAANKVKFDYCLDYARNRRPPSRVPLLKLHGSINWPHCSGNVKSDLPCPNVDVTELHPDYFVDACLRAPANDSNFGWLNYSKPPRGRQMSGLVGVEVTPKMAKASCKVCGSSIRPLLVPPSWTKSKYHQSVQAIWQAACDQLSEAKTVIVIGYSMPESDAYARHLFQVAFWKSTRLKKFVVINPEKKIVREDAKYDRTARARFEALFDNNLRNDTLDFQHHSIADPEALGLLKSLLPKEL